MEQAIIISAANIFSGGTLSIVRDSLEYLSQAGLPYKIIVIVHKTALYPQYDNVEYIELPQVRDSYAKRIWFEYFQYRKRFRHHRIKLWLSLNDMSSRIGHAERKAVYCHNPSPFYKISAREAHLDRTMFFFSLFYRFLYRLNIRQNDFVIVQQEWLRDAFRKMYGVNNVVVAHPSIHPYQRTLTPAPRREGHTVFFYPAFPRVFKNFEVLFKAAEILAKAGYSFECRVTIAGNENKYAAWLHREFGHLEQVRFLGLQNRDAVWQMYADSDCLVFPSKLETWGMPISEMKLLDKPMLVADCAYAAETIGAYGKALLFPADSPERLAELMAQYMQHDLVFGPRSAQKPEEPYTESWEHLFSLLLEERKS
ncbi:glycosyltransferase [Chitinophaga lutea]